MSKRRDVSQAPSLTDKQLEARCKELLEAGESRNTKAAYRCALNHYHNVWGGALPATEQDICRYLTIYSSHHKPSTLRLRLAALSKIHRDLGQPDPTKGEIVQQLMKGIRVTNDAPQKKAKPMTLQFLRQIVEAIDRNATEARRAAAESSVPLTEVQQHRLRRVLLAAARNKALVLLGFWRGFRSDEISRLSVEGIEGARGAGLRIFLQRSKADRKAEGRSFPVPALRELCPVDAYFDWIDEAGIREGRVFRGINRLGELADTGLSSKSMGVLLAKICVDAGLDPNGISTHSLRHGFAHWAADSDWDLQSLMEYVGWANVSNAKGYLPSRYNFGSLALTPARLSEGTAPDVLGATPSIVGVVLSRTSGES